MYPYANAYELETMAAWVAPEPEPVRATHEPTPRASGLCRLEA